MKRWQFNGLSTPLWLIVGLLSRGLGLDWWQVPMILALGHATLCCYLRLTKDET